MNLDFLTNRKPAKDLGTEMLVSSTPGTIKLTPDFAAALTCGEDDTTGVKVGDRVGVVRDADSGQIFVFKSPNDKMGGKVARSGNTFNFSSANSWDVLEGSEEHHRVYVIDGEAVEHEIDEETSITLVPVSFERIEAKMERKSSDDNPEEVEYEEEM